MSRAETLVKRVEPSAFDEPWNDEDTFLEEDEPVRSSGVLRAAAPVAFAEETAEVAAASWHMTVRSLLLDLEALRGAIDEAVAAGRQGCVLAFAQRVSPAVELCAASIAALAERLLQDGDLYAMTLDAPAARLLRAASDWLERIARELMHLLEDVTRGHEDAPEAVEHVGMFSSFDLRMCLLPALTDARLELQESPGAGLTTGELLTTIDELEDKAVQLNWLLRIAAA